MRILVDKVELCGTNAPHEGLSFDGQPSYQVEEYIRATSKKILDRKNLGHTVSFSVTRLHANEDAAEVFMLDHQVAANVFGVITFEGSGYKRYAEGGVTCKGRPPSGVRTFHDYSIVCSAISAKRPS